ncbi:putative Quinone-oxidoreductase like protein, chloroplastic [Glarea lozoyensis 74030]|uniref:Putative Quinone-oxidoreductase like protein, chloroplastic n=1 Tax=Glarea lozoyensis (strain ATCC 74030 / MF5533) TaxID=1104152 RepID=H0EE76_GLAL7|nr:putative Quinone-oxidoreductase like protein, chloroplastic [Glarea lozoyensis 74030]
MKELVVDKDLKVEIHDVPVPKPNADQVLIKIVVSGSNPKDWKVPMWMKETSNSGDDIAGFVEEVGENVTEFKKAALGLYSTTRLGLPEPWQAASSPIPLIVYGASSAVGAYAIQLAQLSNIHPIIAVAGRGQSFVEKLIDRSKGDTIVDYRNGDEALVSSIKDALKGQDIHYAFDAVSEKGSYQNLSKILSTKGGSKITLVLPGRDYGDIPESITHSVTTVGSVHQDSPRAKEGIKISDKEFGIEETK